MPNPPSYGSGPINYARQGGAPDGFDNRIRYSDMVRQQIVSQYQQNVSQPATLTLAQMRQVATGSQYQYGVQGGQNNMARLYTRQSALNRMAYSSAVTGAALGMGAWEAGAAGAAALGIGGAAGFALPIAAAAAPMHFINKGIQNNIDRRRFMHGIAADVEQYRDRLGFSGGLSYGQASQLGSNMTGSMFKGGQFFSRDQQMRIHKIGLSNDMMSARGRGGDSGTIKQYEKNFSELKDTTKDVVKLLQTTIEGGMSVIKELQQKGFGNIRQIRQQVVQAKAFGGMTGMGAQNMMQIGAAGAQAAQGTPWQSTTMAGMFQGGAVQASMMTRGGGMRAQAVQMAGGAASAGAKLGSIHANVMMSGVGVKMAAYAMKADGSMDQGRMDRLLGGGASAYEITSGANQRGYAMGQSGRMMFEYNRDQMLNAMTSEDLELGAFRGFEAWSTQGGRGYASPKARAMAFAKLNTNTARDRNLYYEYLIAPKNFAERDSERRATMRGLSAVGPAKRDLLGEVAPWARSAATGLEGFGAGVANATSEAIGVGGRIMGGIGELPGRAGRGIMERTFGGMYGLYGKGSTGDMTQAARNMSGFALAQSVSPGARARYSRTSVKDIMTTGNTQRYDTGVDIAGAVGGATAQETKYALQQLAAGAGNRTLDIAFQDPNVMRFLGIGKGSEQQRQILANPTGSYNDIAQKINPYIKSTTKKSEEAMTGWENRFKGVSQARSDELEVTNTRAKWLDSDARAKSMEIYDAIKSSDNASTLPYSKAEKDQAFAVANLNAKQDIEKLKGGALQTVTTDIKGAMRTSDIAASRAILGIGAGQADQMLGEVFISGSVFGTGTRKKGTAGYAFQRFAAATQGSPLTGQQQRLQQQERVYKQYRAAGIEVTDPSEMMRQMNAKLENDALAMGVDTDEAKKFQKAVGKIAAEQGMTKAEYATKVATTVRSEAFQAGDTATLREAGLRAGKTTAAYARSKGMSVSDTVEKEIQMAYAGTIRGKKLSVGAAGAIGLAEGLEVAAIQKGFKGDDASGYAMELLTNVRPGPSPHDKYIKDRKQLVADAVLLNSRILSGSKKAVTIKQGEDGEEKTYRSQKEMREGKKDIMDQINLLTMEAASKPATQVAMQPPVLNYWNNKWT